MRIPTEILDTILTYAPVRFAISLRREYVKKVLLTEISCSFVRNRDHVHWLDLYAVQGRWRANAYVTFCAKGYLDDVKWAEERGLNHYHEEALYQAVIHKHLPVVHHLCNRGVQNDEAVACAVGVGDVELVDALHSYPQHENQLARSMMLAKQYGYSAVLRTLYEKDPHLAAILDHWDHNLLRVYFENHLGEF